MKLQDISKEAANLLADYCDFQIGAQPSGLAMLPETDELKLIAGDGMGGCFYEWLSEKDNGDTPIVYLSQYGEASRIASNIQELLSFLVMYEEWGSVLTAAAKGAEIFKRVARNKDMDEEREEACTRLKVLIPSLVDVSDKIYTSINKKPEFHPDLLSVDGVGLAGSFKERPYPK